MEHQPFFDPIEKITVELPDLKGWKVHKGTEPQMRTDEQCSQWIAHHSPMLQEEMLKAAVQHKLLQLCSGNGVENGALTFTIGPSGVWSKKSFKKGQLKLFPAGTISKMKDASKHKAKAVVSSSGFQFAVNPFKSNTEFEDGKGVLDAFYWIKATEDLDAVNMVLKEHTEDNVTAPFLTNTKAW